MRALVVLLLLAGSAGADDARAAFLKGRELHRRGLDGRAEFRRAAAAFRAEAQQEGATPSHWLQCGNAALLADDLPQALWAYHQGLARAPGHRGLRAHLSFARAQVHWGSGRAALVEPDPWPTWLPRWSSTLWFGVGAAAYAFAWLAAALWRLGVRGPWRLGAGAACLVAMASAYALTVDCAARARDLQTPLVVLKVDASLHIGNGTSYPPHVRHPVLPAGAEARRLGRRGSWLRLQLPDGTIGWLPQASVLE